MIFLPHPDFKLPPMRRGECSAALLSPTLRIRTAADWLRPPTQSPPTWPSAIYYRYPLRHGCDGNYLTVDALQAGEQTFSLAGITQPGSYRLYVTVSKDGQRLLTVPYYFIVQ